MQMHSRSLIRGLQVLESFNPQKDNYSLSEMAKNLDIPKSSLYRIVKDLARMNYLRYEVQSKRYYLGMRILSLGFSLLQSMEIREIARPYLEALSKECNMTANLAIFTNDEMVYVDRIRVPGIRQFNVGVGNKVPLWNTAVGRAYISYLDSKKVKGLLRTARKSSNFKMDENVLTTILAEVRKDGFAMNNQEFQWGILAVAVPVFSTSGVVGAINLVGEPENLSVDILRYEYAPKLMSVGKELSNALGYREYPPS
jgi:DNA-binding IclR family transcriptional regulator